LNDLIESLHYLVWPLSFRGFFGAQLDRDSWRYFWIVIFSSKMDIPPSARESDAHGVKYGGLSGIVRADKYGDLSQLNG